MADKPQPLYAMSTVAQPQTTAVTTNPAPTTSTSTFMPIPAFKSSLGFVSMQVVKNPNSGKLFVSAMAADGSTKNLRCQQSIDNQKEMKFLIVDGDMDNACLVNTTNSEANVQFSL